LRTIFLADRFRFGVEAGGASAAGVTWSAPASGAAGRLCPSMSVAG
jgi:hypothetical protein